MSTHSGLTSSNETKNDRYYLQNTPIPEPFIETSINKPIYHHQCIFVCVIYTQINFKRGCYWKWSVRSNLLSFNTCGVNEVHTANLECVVHLTLQRKKSRASLMEGPCLVVKIPLEMSHVTSNHQNLSSFQHLFTKNATKVTAHQHFKWIMSSIETNFTVRLRYN